MASDEKTPPFVVHTIITIVLCLGLFPFGPMIYLFGVAVFYSGRSIVRNRREIANTLFSWIPWKVVAAFLLSSVTAATLFAMAYGTIDHEQMVREGKDDVLFVLTCLSMPVWLAVFYVPGIRRRLKQSADEKSAQLRREKREQDARIRDDERRITANAAQQRRSEARSKCELLYGLHEADIGSRFPRDAFDRYMQKYMGDTEQADVVERRAAELQSVILKHREQVVGVEDPQSIDQLAQWFIEEKARIEALPLDDQMRATHIAHLNIRYAELSQEILEKIRP